MPALGPSYNNFLMAGAKESFKQEKFDECLALTWELFARDPEFPGAASAIQVSAANRNAPGNPPANAPPIRATRRKIVAIAMQVRKWMTEESV